MNLLETTLLYMLLALLLMIVANYSFNKYNFLNYKTLLDTRDKFYLYFTISSFLYLIYIVVFVEAWLPLYILATLLCFSWFYFLIFDIELKVMSIRDRAIIVSITTITITLLWYGVNYIQEVSV